MRASLVQARAKALEEENALKQPVADLPPSAMAKRGWRRIQGAERKVAQAKSKTAVEKEKLAKLQQDLLETQKAVADAELAEQEAVDNLEKSRAECAAAMSAHALPLPFVETLRGLQGLVSSVLPETPAEANTLAGKRASQQGGAPRRRVRRKGPDPDPDADEDAAQDEISEMEEDLVDDEGRVEPEGVSEKQREEREEQQAMAKATLAQPDMAKFVAGCLASLVTLADCLPGEARVELAKAYKDAKGTLPGAQTGSGVTAAIQKHVLQASAVPSGGSAASAKLGGE